MKKVASGRRWEIWVEAKNNQKIATKKSVSESKKWTLLKEVDILRYAEKHKISFIPKVLDDGDGWFSYEWIEGNHFDKEFAFQNIENKTLLIQELLSCAYELDKIGVVHGELLRPWTNVLVDARSKIWILDFERGVMWDYSGKNMKHVAQWLAREWYLDVEEVKWLQGLELDEMYELLTSKIQDSNQEAREKDEHLFRGVSILHALFLPVIFIALDQITKIRYYKPDFTFNSDWITPSFNTGIAWSIPIPSMVVIWVSVVLLWGIIRYYLSEIRSLRTQKWYNSLLMLEYWSILLLSWAIGNLIDRVRLWWVRDFIDVSPIITFYDRPIFNLADVWIVIGVGLLFLYELTK